MASSFRTFLVNDLFGDPALYAGLPWERRALLFDLGDISRLSAGYLLKISDVFVSHAHLDHFVGFDHLLRVLLGRSKALRPMDRRVSSIMWTGNFVGMSGTSWMDTACPSRCTRSARTRSGVRASCVRTDSAERSVGNRVAVDGLLLSEPEFRVRCVQLDHRIPCLGFALEETVQLNVDTVRLEALGLPVGPWLMELKRAVRAGQPDDFPIRVAWSRGGRREERCVALGTLRREVMRESPGPEARVCHRCARFGREP